MRRKRERQAPHHQLPVPKTMPPMQHKPVVPPVPPQKDMVDPISGEPLEQGSSFDMMAYLRKQQLAKQQEMLEKERQNPHYKPLSPTAHKPVAVPSKDRKKMHDAEEKKRRQQGKDPAKDDKAQKDTSLFDQINKEKMLREMQKREKDPSYEPLTPTAKMPKNKKKKDAAAPGE